MVIKQGANICLNGHPHPFQTIPLITNTWLCRVRGTLYESLRVVITEIQNLSFVEISQDRSTSLFYTKAREPKYQATLEDWMDEQITWSLAWHAMDNVLWSTGFCISKQWISHKSGRHDTPNFATRELFKFIM